MTKNEAVEAVLKTEAVEAVIERFKDANSELQARLYDHDPERVRELMYRVTDIIDSIACMEEPEEEEISAVLFINGKQQELY